MDAHRQGFDFRHLTTGDLDVYRKWFDAPTVWMWMAYPTDDWFAFVSGAYARCWGVFGRDQLLVGVIQVEVEDEGLAHMSFVVAPDLRGRAFGSRMLRAFLSGPGRVWSEVEVDVESDNIAAIRCLHSCGFDPSGPDPGGPERDDGVFVQFVRRQHRIAAPRTHRARRLNRPISPRRAN
jgi:ribosomal protein S18 acetylase RimI-like enzyme